MKHGRLCSYLLEKWHRRCAYCGAQSVPLEIEPIQPKSRGGSDRVSNLTLACRTCNQRKGNQPIEVFLAHRSERLRRIQAQAKAPLRDAAAVNATRWALFEQRKATGLPVTTGSGGQTKYNRSCTLRIEFVCKHQGAKPINHGRRRAAGALGGGSGSVGLFCGTRQ